MTIELRVAEKRLDGFSRGSVQMTLDEPVASFDVEYVADEKAMFPGDPVELWLDDELLIGGYVDSTDDEDSPEQLTLRAAGRSKTQDLIDCSAEPHVFARAMVGDIATHMAKPYGITARVEGDPGPAFPAFHVQEGETALETILRAAQKRGMYCYPVGAELVLGRAGTLRTDTLLVRGERPLMRSSRADSWYSRYSHYTFRGQVRATDAMWGPKAAQLEHVVRDYAITRYRPLKLQAEVHAVGDLKTRAETERNQRAARGERIQVTLFGHKTLEGFTWRPNLLVRFRNPKLGVDAVLLVVVVRLRFSESDADETELELTRPEAYDLVNYPALGRGIEWT